MRPRSFPLLLLFLLLAAACASPTPLPTLKPTKKYPDLVVGFSHTDLETEWHVALANSSQETAAQLGATVKFSDAEGKQENQIKALRSFIADGVDAIGIDPIVVMDWETVFQEAK